MIIGIGTDTTTVERIEKSMQSPAFINKCFGHDEYAFLNAKKHAGESAAANFAAKEALLKALGLGLGGFKLCEAEVLRNPLGAPYFAFSGDLAKKIDAEKITVFLSLTHEGGFATAFVVVERI